MTLAVKNRRDSSNNGTNTWTERRSTDTTKLELGMNENSGEIETPKR